MMDSEIGQTPRLNGAFLVRPERCRPRGWRPEPQTNYSVWIALASLVLAGLLGFGAFVADWLKGAILSTQATNACADACAPECDCPCEGCSDHVAAP